MRAVCWSFANFDLAAPPTYQSVFPVHLVGLEAIDHPGIIFTLNKAPKGGKSWENRFSGIDFADTFGHSVSPSCKKVLRFLHFECNIVVLF